MSNSYPREPNTQTKQRKVISHELQPYVAMLYPVNYSDLSMKLLY